jgi:hypothetical protein
MNSWGKLASMHAADIGHDCAMLIQKNSMIRRSLFSKDFRFACLKQDPTDVASWKVRQPPTPTG